MVWQTRGAMAKHVRNRRASVHLHNAESGVLRWEGSTMALSSTEGSRRFVKEMRGPGEVVQGVGGSRVTSVHWYLL